MSYLTYRLIHLGAVFGILSALSAASILRLSASDDSSRPHARTFKVVHAIAAFLILLGGFGMLARLGTAEGGLPGWIVAKMGIWLAVAGAMWLQSRSRSGAKAVLVLVPVLALLAAVTALTKPF